MESREHTGKLARTGWSIGAAVLLAAVAVFISQQRAPAGASDALRDAASVLRDAPADALPDAAVHTQDESGVKIFSIDHSKIVGNGPEGGNCIGCHQKEHEAWTKTHHHRSLEKLQEGPEIARRLGMGFDYMEKGFCIECHTTAKAGEEAGMLKPITGVSCESCHGPAKEWVKIHNDYGEGKTAQTEDAAHKAERHRMADEAGMIRKDRIDLIARNCYNCHLVPNEKLVNTGGHKTASDFELVAWLHGEVRHNYYMSDANKDTSQNRKRLLYVTGKAVDMEMTLRAAKSISEKGHYRSAILNRIRSAAADLDAAIAATDIPELKAVWDRAADKPPRRDDGSLGLTRDMLDQLPGALQAATKKFVENHDGGQLAGVDQFLPAPDAYKGAVSP